MRYRPTLFSLAILAALTPVASRPPAPPYRVTGRIAAPDGGWDYARIDPAMHRLYVARATEVTVVDLASGNKVTSIGEIAGGHAVVPVGNDLLLVTSGHDDSVRLLEMRDGHQVARIAVGSGPDAAFYDVKTGMAAVMDAKAGTVSLLDVLSRRITRTVTLKPGLEYAALAEDGTVFVNNEDANEIESFDLRSGAVGPTISLPGCEGPTGLAFDGPTHRLISACANGKAALVDVDAKRLVALLPIGLGPDAVIVDGARRLAFVPCGRDGVLTVIGLDTPGGATVVETIRTEPGARTGALDPQDGTLYLPTARFASPAPGGKRSAPLPGSFHILVVSPSIDASHPR